MMISAMRNSTIFLTVSLTILLHLSSAVAGPKALKADELPNDIRLKPLKDLNGYFPFKPTGSKTDWDQRAEYVRRQILVSQGLWPMPTKTPLNPIVHGKVDKAKYSVEKVFFQSMPGFFVTGSLYRPKGFEGKRPVVLSPHGHWNEGRFYDAGEDAVRNEIISGAERFEDGGRSPMQSRCVQLARMGSIVFHYDMIGYADSTQISFDLAHKFSKQRPEMNTLENWGLFSPQAEARSQSVMGLQTYNTIRALDFVESLEDVDPDRIAVTGASGGGTQTFIIGAIDPRPKVIFPAVMVSTAMQGGCTCENASGLRVNTGNIEFAALFAPKPLGLSAANDWTVEMETKGFPDLQNHYAAFGNKSDVHLTALTHFGHNYNYVSRSAMYRWFNKHLELGLSEPIVEESYDRLSKEQMSNWNESTELSSGPDFERELLSWWTTDATTQIESARPNEREYKAIAGKGIDILIGRSLKDVGVVEWDIRLKEDKGDHLEMTGLLTNVKAQEQLPATFLYPHDWNKNTVLWISNDGKSAMFGEDGAPVEGVQALLDTKSAVAGIDLLYQGEFLADKKQYNQARKVSNNREFAGYTFGYNHSLFARRVHDILTLIQFTQTYKEKSDSVSIIGLNGAGHWVAAAISQCGDAIDTAVIDSAGFRFSKLLDFRDPNFLPGGASYDGLAGMVATSSVPNVLLDEALAQEANAITSEWLIPRNFGAITRSE
jgi:dienelactone hydrolase